MARSVRLIQHGGKCCSLTQIVSMVNIFPHRSSSRALTQMPLIPVLLSGDSSWCHHLTASIKVELSCLKRRQRKRTTIISSLRRFTRNLWGLNCHLRDHPNFGLTFLYFSFILDNYALVVCDKPLSMSILVSKACTTNLYLLQKYGETYKTFLQKEKNQEIKSLSLLN